MPAPAYIVQVHGEWSGMADIADEDYEFDTLQDAEKFIATEMVKGCVYVLQTADYETVREGTA